MHARPARTGQILWERLLGQNLFGTLVARVVLFYQCATDRTTIVLVVLLLLIYGVEVGVPGW